MAIQAYRWVMKAVGQPMERELFDPGAPGPGEVVIEVAGCGVCHTDLGFYYDGVRTNHPLPLTLGHEISGHVVAAGKGADEWMRRAVIVPAMFQCGECDPCKRGKGTLCSNERMPGNDIDGASPRISGCQLEVSCRSTSRDCAMSGCRWHRWPWSRML